MYIRLNGYAGQNPPPKVSPDELPAYLTQYIDYSAEAALVGRPFQQKLRYVLLRTEDALEILDEIIQWLEWRNPGLSDARESTLSYLYPQVKSRVESKLNNRFIIVGTNPNRGFIMTRHAPNIHKWQAKRFLQSFTDAIAEASIFGRNLEHRYHIEECTNFGMEMANLVKGWAVGSNPKSKRALDAAFLEFEFMLRSAIQKRALERKMFLPFHHRYSFFLYDVGI